jgi:hypothetical protein
MKTDRKRTAEGTFVRNLLAAIDGADLIDGAQIG